MSEGQWREDADRPMDNRPTLTETLDQLQKEIETLDDNIRGGLRDKLTFVSLPDETVPIDDSKANPARDIPAPTSEAIAKVTHMTANVRRMQAELRHIIDRVRI